MSVLLLYIVGGTITYYCTREIRVVFSRRLMAASDVVAVPERGLKTKRHWKETQENEESLIFLLKV